MAEPGGWHTEDIKAALRKRFGSLAKLSTAWGYDCSAVSGVLRKPPQSPPMERRIAAALDVPLHVLWPDRWHSDGTPKPRYAIVRRPRRLFPKSQKEGAA